MDPDASIILVGVRGAGKRTLGLIAATALNWRYITEDLYFEKTTGKTRAAYIETYGSPSFYKKNVEVIRSMLLTHRDRCVIECGWGSLSSEIHELLQNLCATHPVIHITRSLKQIQSLLQLDKFQTSLFRRADEYHRECSIYEFYNIHDWTDQDTSGEVRQSTLFSAFRLKDAKAQFCSFLDRVRKDGSTALSSQINRPLSAIPLVERRFTHMVPILLSDLVTRSPPLGEMEFIEDAVELKIDAFSRHAGQRVSEKVAALRRHFGVPIMYGVAVPKEKGTSTTGECYTDAQVLSHGLRLAVDFLVVDISCLTADIQNVLSKRRSTRVMGHCEIPWDDYSPVQKGINMYRKAAALGCDIARIVYVNGTEPTGREMLDQCLTALRDSVSSFASHRPALITYGAGFSGCEAGQISNEILTPVYHPELSDRESGPHRHLTTKEAMKIRFQQRQLDPLRIYLIGNVSLRVAPAMFKAALDAAGLAFEYVAQDTIDGDGLKELAKDDRFGGASITYGFKTIVSPYVDLRSEHAMAIGAVNTLLPLRTSANVDAPSGQGLLVDRGRAGPIHGWYGDNTDWIGMTVCIQRNLSPRNAIQPAKTAGLVLGGGGMARAAIYTMLRLGVKNVLVFNPTAEDPNLLPQHFNAWLQSHGRDNQMVSALLDTQEPWPSNTEQPIVIISCPAVITANAAIAPNAEVPLQWLQSKTGGVVLEMAYKPLITPLLQQVQDLRTRSGRPWVTVNGLEMLTEQGSVQFELLTGRRAPRQTMRMEARKAYGEEELDKNI
ncbi:uncharacterized protein Z518_05727 [Rhinocladiella mackenziei CBS 650.93]|uniref:Quinate repressor protein n=1 Tax=Rhinocladiella mackenziei CBS 650.93 TaxID=1442369 RepID=A0A0D2INY7_9EURO|nr:uncharacterized protein Z518_05727 [Rhinocladiella mackenziei CBS 650.93]KIX04856.1 hypothetical protein Z518_05727 [Rhinocladiella mackenziei CBS 650.93]